MQTHDDQTTPLAARSEPVSPLSLFPNSAGVEPQLWKEIEAIEHQLACYNAGDWRRAAALYTDSYLSRIVAASVDRMAECFPAEPRPIDQMNWKTVDIDDIRGDIRRGHEILVTARRYSCFMALGHGHAQQGE